MVVVTAELTEAEREAGVRFAIMPNAGPYYDEATVEKILTARLTEVEAERDEWRARSTDAGRVIAALEQQLADLRASITAKADEWRDAGDGWPSAASELRALLDAVRAQANSLADLGQQAMKGCPKCGHWSGHFEDCDQHAPTTGEPS